MRRRTKPQQRPEAGVGPGRSLRLRTRKLRPSDSLTEAEHLQWKQPSSVSSEVPAYDAPTMASAVLGLTPRWVMFLGAVLLLLLPGASAQEPPGVGKARGPRSGGGGRVGRIQGGAQPRGLGVLWAHALPWSLVWQPLLGVNVVP